MKFERYLLFGFMITIILGFFWYDHKVKGLEDRLAEAQGIKPDTVKVEIQIRDTVFVSVADTVIDQTDTTVVGDTVVVHHWPTLVDNTSQPLFDLRVSVDSRKNLFDYNFKYKPLTLRFAFRDKYDLRKGFELTMSPDIGDINVDWGEYQPLKKPKGFELAAGFGYSTVKDNESVFLLGSLKFKKNEFGLILRDKGKDYYYKRTLWSF